ncbi:MAG: hypothetical protein J5554_09875 [Paludibacteraceae bacterium]|nr:hypothetical protein [Paludibacteraceae bacterium]
MKIFRTTYSFIALISALLLLSACQKNDLNWDATLMPDDTHPFSCGILDELCKERYGDSFLTDTLERKDDTYNIDYDKFKSTDYKNILYISDISHVDNEWELFVERMKMGYNTIIACENFALGKEGKTPSQFPKSYSTFELAKALLKDEELPQAMILTETEEDYTNKVFTHYNFPVVFCKNNVSYLDDSFLWDSLGLTKEILLFVNETRTEGAALDPIAIQLRDTTSMGSIIWVGTPLLFTNYNILHEKNDKLIFSLIDRALTNPTEVDSLGNSLSGNSTITHIYDPMFSISYKSLTQLMLESLGKNLLWLIAIAFFILFVVFYGKRKQRLIPEIKPASNRTIGFVEQISNVYYYRNEYDIILKKKITFFFDFIKDRLHIDLQDKSKIESNASRLMAFYLQDKEKTVLFINDLNEFHKRKDKKITHQQMIKCIDAINVIYQNFKGKKQDKKNDSM